MNCVILKKLRVLTLLAILVITSISSYAATDLKVSINGEKSVIGVTLKQAIGSTPLSTITSLEIKAGDFTFIDWEFLKSNKVNLTSLTDFTITDEITSVADVSGSKWGDAYFNDTLEKIYVAKLDTIKNSTFYNCVSLKSASFPEVTSIEREAFCNCTSLKAANFPKVTRIDYGVFKECTSLKIASFAEVTSIGSDAFYNCSALSKLTLGLTPPSLDEMNPFEGTPSTRYIELVDEKGNRILGDKLSEAEKTYVKANIRWDAWIFISDLVTAVTLDKTNKQIETFTPFTLKPTFTPTHPSYNYVSWTSSNENVAGVSAEGKVYGLSNGTTTITVHAENNQIATCEVSVVNGNVNKDIFYVKEMATGRGNGSSWDNASGNLNDALTFANEINAMKEGAIKQIWVAKGTYKPSKSPVVGDINDRNKAFVLFKGVSLYGGFTGEETMLSERNWETNKTILSGDIGVENEESDNCYHILITLNAENVKLDGFTITGGNIGNANDIGYISLDKNMIYHFNGGALYNYNSGNMFINNCVFKNNKGYVRGGALFLSNSDDVVINNCIFSNNTSQGFGGAIYNNYGDLDIINSTFYKNEAGKSGGVCYLMDGTSQIFNCIFWDNRIAGKNNLADADLGFYQGPSLKIFNTALQLKIDNYSKETITLKNNLYGQDPLFVTPEDGDLTLQATSPCMNTGSELLYDTEVYGGKDLAGEYRIIDAIDMGAYEYTKDVPMGIEKNRFSTPTTYLYPTLTNTGFTVKMPEGIATLQLYNLGGELVKSSNVTNGTYVDISTLSKGIYVVHLNNESMKIIKK